ncbi:hypothetical protein AB6D77_08080 [Vibrio splendidus]
MYFHQILKLFAKDKKTSQVDGIVNTQNNKVSDTSLDDLVTKCDTEQNETLPEIDSETDSMQMQQSSLPSDKVVPEINPLQGLAERAFKESGASFHSELFPNKESNNTRSNRNNPRVIVKPSKESDFFDLCMNNIRHVSVGDYLRVRQNGIYNDANCLVSDFDSVSQKIKYRDSLKVEEVFEATLTAPAYLKVEVIGYELLLVDYIELERKNVKTHDGQNLLSVARDYVENTNRSKKNYGYKLHLVEDGYTYYVLLYYGSIERASVIDFGIDGQGSDGCIVLGTASAGLISDSTRSQMFEVTDEYDRPHPSQRCLGWKSSLELIVEHGKIYLCTFDTQKPVRQLSDTTIRHNSQPNKANGYVRLENGKYRCASTDDIFVSCWFFSKKHSVKLSDVDVLRAAQADSIRHEKKCRIEFESARQVWGDYVYMYPEKWLEHQSPRLW